MVQIIIIFNFFLWIFPYRNDIKIIPIVNFIKFIHLIMKKKKKYINAKNVKSSFSISLNSY